MLFGVRVRNIEFDGEEYEKNKIDNVIGCGLIDFKYCYCGIFWKRRYGGLQNKA